MEIIYYADNGSMGDTSDNQCDLYREWAEKELKAEYPNYDITVTTDDNMATAWTDDEENRDEIIEFCSNLWSDCPWDWDLTE